MSDQPSHVTLPPRDEATVDHLSADSAQPEAAAPARVRYFGDYELIREIARGGMGVVFHARQMSLNRPVALKMILTGQLANETDIRRFYIEAESAANLDHAGIVPIFEVGQHEGQHYFSMGFVEGQSLSQRLAGRPLPPREAAALMVKVAEAIAYAHQRGVIHRDLKPANILIDAQGHPRVTDFGLAKKVQGDSGLTGSGQFMGTPSYMPPEQTGGGRGEVGPAADVYALGATLYALVTGRTPFQAATPMDTVNQVISAEPVPPRRLNASVPRDLETICLKCLEKEPGKRYASAAALGEDLGRYLAGEPILARPVTRSERAFKWARRKPAIAALLGLVALVAALGLGGVLWQWRQAVRARGVAERETARAKSQTELAGERLADAVKARAEERKQTELAEQRLQDTLKARAEEKKQTELAEQRLYDVRMTLVEHYWEDYNGEFLRQALDEQVPARQRGIDRRGFEWFYWRRKISSGHITLKGHTDGVSSVAFSPAVERLLDAVQELAPDQVASVAFSPDGKRLASASRDGKVKLWNAATGQEIRTLKGPVGDVTSVAFSPDGKRLASASRDGKVKLWNAATGQEIRPLKGHTGPVWSVVFSPDGQRLASAGGESDKPGEVKVWDAGTGKETHTLKGHTGPVVSVAFSPDGKRIASASSDETVRMWDAAAGQQTLTFKGHGNRISSVAYSPDGRILGSAQYLVGVTSVAFSPDGKRLASASADGVEVWDTATGQVIRTLKGHASAVTSVAFSPDGQRIASANLDGTVKVWDAATGQEMLTLKGHTAGLISVAFSPDGKWLASASADGVKVWEAGTGQETRTIKGRPVRIVGFSPDGQRIASVDMIGTVTEWDAETGREIRTEINFVKWHTDGVCSAAVSPDGQRIASANFDGTVKVWDAATGQETFTLKGHAAGFMVMSAAFSPDGTRLASAGGKMVKVWDAATGQETLTLTGHMSGAFSSVLCDFSSVVFSPDGKRLAAGSVADGTVKVWDAATGQETLTLKGNTGLVSGVAFSPDGKRLAAASWNRTVKVWDAATGHEIHTLKRHTGPVVNVAFSPPDGKRLVSASLDGTVKVWDAATGQETLTLKGHAAALKSVAFSPDGKQLVSASVDGTVKIWDARPLDDEPAKPGPTSR
jgi:WD40 repeat protein